MLISEEQISLSVENAGKGSSHYDRLFFFTFASFNNLQWQKIAGVKNINKTVLPLFFSFHQKREITPISKKYRQPYD